MVEKEEKNATCLKGVQTIQHWGKWTMVEKEEENAICLFEGGPDDTAGPGQESQGGKGKGGGGDHL